MLLGPILGLLLGITVAGCSSTPSVPSVLPSPSAPAVTADPTPSPTPTPTPMPTPR
jgi:hypothetical protein